ncbi:hypothetical protein Q9L58_005119 [Maublancomyces gigas]|uniref:Uncharacterized protein n=1 Tax=Discina gigas TaxID=1032678 RepID=A0ABR3GJZ9_9PEZI
MASPPPTPSKISYHILPPPRSSGPLKPGSRPESNLITYLDDQLLQVSRRYAKKYHEGGYATVEAVAEDLERLMANSFNDYLASFPPQLKSTLSLLDTFDRCFYTLITGSSVDPSTSLSSEFSVSRMNMTEKVRLKSIIKRTRLHIVKLAEKSMSTPDLPTDTDGKDDDEMDIETGDETDVDGDNQEHEEWEIEVMKVYDRSLIQIGEGLKEI